LGYGKRRGQQGGVGHRVNILEKHRRGVFEVGGLMRMPGKLGCNL